MPEFREPDFLDGPSGRHQWDGLGEPDIAPRDSASADIASVDPGANSALGSPETLSPIDPLPVTRRSERKTLKMGEVSTVRWIVETIGLLLLALLLAQGIKTFLIQPYIVPTGSMIPTIQIGDRILANKLVFWTGGEPERGDIVVLDDPTGQFDMLVKRVVATAGQTVDLVDGAVVVDGELLIEPYAHGLRSDPQVMTFPYEVPAGDVWVMGDNRTNSADSRSFGSVRVDSIRGRAFWTYWPIDRFQALK